MTELERIFADAVGRYFDGKVLAEWEEFPDLKVKWVRGESMSMFMVSDYLRDAPEPILASIATTLSDSIWKGEKVDYPKETVEYLTSNEFRERNLKMFMERQDLLPAREDSPIRRAMDGLLKRGLVTEDEVSTVTLCESTRVGHSLLMDAIWADDIDEEELWDILVDHLNGWHDCKGAGRTREEYLS